MVEQNWAGNVAYGAARFDVPTSVADIQALSLRVRNCALLAATFVQHDRRHRWRPGVTRGPAARCGARPASTNGHGRWRHQIRRAGDAAARERMGTCEPGVVAAHLRGRRLRHGDARQWRRHREPRSRCRRSRWSLHRATSSTSTRDDDPDTVDAITVGLGALESSPGSRWRSSRRLPSLNTCYEHLPMQTAVDRLPEIMADGYSVSLFTMWGRDRDRATVAKAPRRRRHRQRRRLQQSSIRGDAGDPRDAPDRRGGVRRVHRAVGRCRAMARTAPAFQDGFHSEQRRRVAVGALRRSRRCAGSDARPRGVARRARTGPEGVGGACSRGRQPVAQHVLPA